jgi:hypothetical protein
MEESMAGDGDLLASLTRIWKEELLLALPDPDADFVELNGASLTAVRIARRIEEDTRVPVDVGLLYDYSTPRALAEVLADQRA